MAIRVKRIYEPPSTEDGIRLLVDRIWPRGVSRDASRLDGWLKELAPSEDLRRWFDHEADRWNEFRRRYLAELKEHREQAREIAARAEHGVVTLLFAARNPERNNAVVLGHYLTMFRTGADK